MRDIDRLFTDEGASNIETLIERVKHLESLPLISTTSGLSLPIREENADYTIAAGDFSINGDASGLSITFTLPTAASSHDANTNTGDIYNVKKIDATANTVTLAGNGAETIDGSNTQVILFQYDEITVQSDGTEWWIVL